MKEINAGKDKSQARSRIGILAMMAALTAEFQSYRHGIKGLLTGHARTKHRTGKTFNAMKRMKQMLDSNYGTWNKGQQWQNRKRHELKEIMLMKYGYLLTNRAKRRFKQFLNWQDKEARNELQPN